MILTYNQIMFYGDRVWLLCNKVMQAWTLPTFMPLETYSGRPAEVVPPEFTVDITSPSKGYDTFVEEYEASWISCQDWYTNFGSSVTSFDIAWTEKGRDKVTTYPLSHIYTENPPTRAIEPMSSFDMPALAWDTLLPRTVDYTRFCGDFLVKSMCSFRQPYALNLVISPISSKKSKSFRVALPIETKTNGKNDVQSQDEDLLFDAMHSQLFDPIAGRCCRISEDDSKSILVWDYLDF